ncbi:dynein regulatory complex subunit 7-like [Aphidius gifuensis]|uniref:dynein regulatory complex subunit 7-like n=1 Tax=Aphidius gifuensis TaxID=684658 RepID=UPI001CDC876B|nr:dynein regulatory complex subunit 7-like [Aphidius gifuensis]
MCTINLCATRSRTPWCSSRGNGRRRKPYQASNLRGYILHRPEKLCSPTWLIRTQIGNSFEISTLLCSILLGQYYNAFVVSGYASREQTLNDTSNRPYIYFKKSNESWENTNDVEISSTKYKFKPPPDFRSKLLTESTEFEVKELNRLHDDDDNDDEKDCLNIDMNRQSAECEETFPDEYSGHRVHAWIIIMPDNKTDVPRHPEIKKSFFIEPSSGQKYDIDEEINKYYHGIESLWNHENYWLNLQSCNDGCDKLNFDLFDNKMWEHLLPGEPSSYHHRNSTINNETDDEDNDSMNILQRKHLDMPVSYVEEIKINSLDFERRYLNGKKIMFFKKTKVEVYAPYVQMDGLIESVTIYNYDEYKFALKIIEKYSNRGDGLVGSTKYLDSQLVVDEYERGRPDACKEHRYLLMGTNSIDEDRTLEFYHTVRNDGLEKIETKKNFFSQYYVGRQDYLCYRNVEFAVDKKPIANDIHHRKIIKITEEFKRNPNLAATKDIAIRVFDMVDDEIRLIYHYGNENISRATRTFVKPSIAERGDRLVFDPNMTHGYNPDFLAQPEKPLVLFYMLEKLLDDEFRVINCVRNVETDVDEFLKLRQQEYFMPKLLISIFDTNRNDDTKAELFAKEEMARVQAQRQFEEQIDYLQPYLSKIGNPKSLGKYQQLQIRQECLNDFKQTMVKRANDISQKITLSNQKYKELLDYRSQAQEISNEDEEKLTNEIDKITFDIHALEMRLKRHCNLSNQRYLKIQKSLDNDKRLSSL